MADTWIEEQKTRLADNETRLEDLKKRVLPRRDVQAHREPLPIPATAERLEKRQFWLAIALVVLNGFCFWGAIRNYIRGQETVSIMVDEDNVDVFNNTTGGGHTFRVKLPLNRFPYNLELNQYDLSQWIGPAIANLVLLAALLVSFRERSKLKAAQPLPVPAAEVSQHIPE